MSKINTLLYLALSYYGFLFFNNRVKTKTILRQQKARQQWTHLDLGEAVNQRLCSQCRGREQRKHLTLLKKKAISTQEIFAQT